MNMDSNLFAKLAAPIGGAFAFIPDETVSFIGKCFLAIIFAFITWTTHKALNYLLSKYMHYRAKHK